MKTIEKVFDQDFYANVYKAIRRKADEDDYVQRYLNGERFMLIVVDGICIEMEVTFHVRWQDDSFSHAFGIERFEPYPILENLTSLHIEEVYDENGDISGFSLEDFWAYIGNSKT